MALVNCRECGKAVSDSAKTCPSCGVKNPIPKPPKKKMPESTKVLLLGGFLSVLSFSLFNGIAHPERNASVSVVQTESSENCNVKMKNGLMADRPCDLVELCKDLHFQKKRATQYYLDGKISDQYQAEGDTVKILGWLAKYDADDVMRVCEPDEYAKLEARDRQRASSQFNATNAKGEDKKNQNPNPFTVFVVGNNVSKVALIDLLNKNFPGSILEKDGSISVESEGAKYKISTRLTGSNDEREILSISKI